MSQSSDIGMRNRVFAAAAGQHARHTSTVGNLKTVFQRDRIIVHMQAFRTVWLLCNLSFDMELCLRDDKYAAYFARQIFCKQAWTTSSYPAHKPYVVPD